MTQVQISNRFRLPFYPMRPRLGMPIVVPEDLDALDPEYFWQLKVNGDRALLGVVGGKTYIANRHGTWLKFAVDNAKKFEKLKGSWLFDGEVLKKNFYPFELLENNRGPLAGECPSVRAEAAMEVCQKLKIEWLYGTEETLKQIASPFILEQHGAPYEGVVGKLKGSRYVPLGSASKDSMAWTKRKWA